MSNFGIKHFKKPTPRSMVKLGNSLALAALFGASFSFATENEWIGCFIVSVGVIGKFITEFFSEPETICRTEQKPTEVKEDEVKVVNVGEDVQAPSPLSPPEEASPAKEAKLQDAINLEKLDVIVPEEIA
jgi:hypothetical protein